LARPSVWGPGCGSGPCWSWCRSCCSPAYAVNGGYTNQPAPYPDRFDLNERVFRAPTRHDVDLLRDRYGVRWLVADGSVGPVSADLADYAVPRYAAGPVTVFELPAR